MYNHIRPYLFRLNPERAHELTLFLLRNTQQIPPALWLLKLIYSAPAKPVEAFGLTF